MDLVVLFSYEGLLLKCIFTLFEFSPQLYYIYLICLQEYQEQVKYGNFLHFSLYTYLL